MYFWRTHGGQEVDFIVERGPATVGIEVKAGMTPRPALAASLRNALENWPEPQRKAVRVYGGDSRFESGDCLFLPWAQVETAIEN